MGDVYPVIALIMFLFDVRLKNDIGTGLVCCRGQGYSNLMKFIISKNRCG